MGIVTVLQTLTALALADTTASPKRHTSGILEDKFPTSLQESKLLPSPWPVTTTILSLPYSRVCTSELGSHIRSPQLRRKTMISPNNYQRGETVSPFEELVLCTVFKRPSWRWANMALPRPLSFEPGSSQCWVQVDSFKATSNGASLARCM